MKDKSYLLSVLCEKELGDSIERGFSKSLGSMEILYLDLHGMVIRTKETAKEICFIVEPTYCELSGAGVWPIKPKPTFWVNRYCVECGHVVYTRGSEKYNADYTWVCSNNECAHSKEPEHTGDMDPPAWTKPLPEDIGKRLDCQDRVDKGLLQRLYEHDIDFRIDVDRNNPTIGDRILMVDLFSKTGECIAHVLSDDVRGAERWLLNQMRLIDPAMIESLEKELIEEQELLGEKDAK